MVSAQKGRRGWDKLMKMGLSLGRVVRTSPKRFEKRSEWCGACQRSRKENSAGRGHSAGKGLEAEKTWTRQENETKGLEQMQDGEQAFGTRCGRQGNQDQNTWTRRAIEDLDLSQEWNLGWPLHAAVFSMNDQQRLTGKAAQYFVIT